MKKIMIQFHATLEELVEYLNSVSSELGLVMTMMILKPFALNVVKGELSLDELALERDIRILLTKAEPNLEGESPNKFYDLNPGTVDLDIGKLSKIGLHESALSFMSDDKEKISLANKLASRLKKRTHAGAIAVNPVSGAEANARTHRYTDGAKAMYNDGVKILPVAGNCFFKLAD